MPVIYIDEARPYAGQEVSRFGLDGSAADATRENSDFLMVRDGTGRIQAQW